MLKCDHQVLAQRLAAGLPMFHRRCTPVCAISKDLCCTIGGSGAPAMVGEPRGHGFPSHPGPADASRFARTSFVGSGPEVFEPARVLACLLWHD